MDITLETDLTTVPEAELLRQQKRWDPVSEVYLNITKELFRRQKVKENKINEAQQKNEKTQRKIEVMTFVIMILTIIILLFTVAQFYKSPAINHSPTDKKPITETEKP